MAAWQTNADLHILVYNLLAWCSTVCCFLVQEKHKMQSLLGAGKGAVQRVPTFLAMEQVKDMTYCVAINNAANFWCSNCSVGRFYGINNLIACNGCHINK